MALRKCATGFTQPDEEKKKKTKNTRRKNDNTARTPGSSRMENTQKHTENPFFLHALLRLDRFLRYILNTGECALRSQRESILRSRASCRGGHRIFNLLLLSLLFASIWLLWVLCHAELRWTNHHTRVVALNQACIVVGAVRGLSIIHQCVWCTLPPKTL